MTTENETTLLDIDYRPVNEQSGNNAHKQKNNELDEKSKNKKCFWMREMKEVPPRQKKIMRTQKSTSTNDHTK